MIKCKINFYNSKNIVEESFIIDKDNSNHTIIIMKAEQQYKGTLLSHNYLPTIPIQFAQVNGNLFSQYIKFEIQLTIQKNKTGRISSAKMEVGNTQGKMFLTLK